MACFVVPVAEAVIGAVATRIVKSKENAHEAKLSLPSETADRGAKIPFSQKLGWLNKMLCGGSALLAFEHVWHGEISASFPFFTAVANGETAEMLAEMGSTGVLMALVVTGVWGGMVAVSSVLEKKQSSSAELVKEDI